MSTVTIAPRPATQPAAAAEAPRPRAWRRAAPGLLGVASVLAASLGWSLVAFGSPRDAWHYLQGRRLVIDAPAAAVEPAPSGQRRTATFLVRNISGRPCTILGANASCTCLATDAMPLVIPPGSSHALRATLKLEGEPGARISQVIAYVTDDPRQPDIRVQVTGRVSE